jgi:dTDP-4-dehydrorhamnose reductase
MAFKRIAITGANGMLGQELERYLTVKGYTVFGFDSQMLNLLHPVESLEKILQAVEPEIIIHAGAYTRVDKAEEEAELAMSINKDGSRNMALIAKKLDAIFVYISTDYVFDGLSETPYQPNDRPKPVNTYGLSKYYGELMVSELLDMFYVIRTSWTYGIAKNNFVQWILDSARLGSSIQVAKNWFGSPTWIGNLCVSIETIMNSGAYGYYHVADQGNLSRYEQAKTICEVAGLSSEFIQPVLLQDLPLAANRPPKSALACPGIAVPSWQTGLNAYLSQYHEKIKPTASHQY